MNITQIGQIYNFLIEHKTIRSYESSRIKRSVKERELAQILDTYQQRLDDLDEFLATQGVKLQALNVQDYGIANQGTVYVLIREMSGNEAPEHLRTKHLWEQLKSSFRKDSKQTTVIWASYLYLQLLHHLYTLDNRAIEAISRFHESWLDADIFQDEVIKVIEQLRARASHPEYATSTIHQELIAATDTDIAKRVTSFLNSMVKLGVLVKAEDIGLKVGRKESRTIYQQTLWSAVDIAENFKRNAGLLVQRPAETEVHELAKVHK